MDSEGESRDDPNRSIESLIAYVKQNSRFQRVGVSDRSDTRQALREADGTSFRCVRITKSDDPLCGAVRRLFLKSFSSKERDSFRELKDIVTDKDFETYALVDLEGNAIGAVCAGFFEFHNKLARTKELIVFIDNIVIDPLFQGKGLARELYLAVCESAQKRAEIRGVPIRAILGEAKSEVEAFWNKLGWKRIYFYRARECSAANPLEEVPYFQPSLQWDFAKGVSQNGYGPTPTHLMAWVADSKWRPLTVSELIMIIESVYLGNFLPNQKFFTNERAYRRCKGELRRLLQKTQDVLFAARFPALLLLTKEERERAGLS